MQREDEFEGTLLEVEANPCCYKGSYLNVADKFHHMVDNIYPSEVESDFPTIDMIISQALVVWACRRLKEKERRFVKRRRKSLV